MKVLGWCNRLYIALACDSCHFLRHFFRNFNFKFISYSIFVQRLCGKPQAEVRNLIRITKAKMLTIYIITQYIHTCVPLAD